MPPCCVVASLHNSSRSAHSPRTSCTCTFSTWTCVTLSAACVARRSTRCFTAHSRILFFFPSPVVRTHFDFPYRRISVFQLVTCMSLHSTRTCTGCSALAASHSTCVIAAVRTCLPSISHVNIVGSCVRLTGWSFFRMLRTGRLLPAVRTGRTHDRGTRPATHRSPIAFRHFRSLRLTSLLCTCTFVSLFHTRTGISIHIPSPPCLAANSCHGSKPLGLRLCFHAPVSSWSSQFRMLRSCCCLRVLAPPLCCPQ